MATTTEETDDNEEMYILLEVTGIINADSLSKSGSCRILGLNSENPILQVGNYVFSGEYKDTVGTALFFTEDQQDKSGQKLQYICKTSRKLAMQRAIMKPKKPTDAENDSDSQPK